MGIDTRGGGQIYDVFTDRRDFFRRDFFRRQIAVPGARRQRKFPRIRIIKGEVR